MQRFFSEYSIITPFLQIIPVESGVIFYAEQERTEQQPEPEQKSEQSKQQSGLIF